MLPGAVPHKPAEADLTAEQVAPLVQQRLPGACGSANPNMAAMIAADTAERSLGRAAAGRSLATWYRRQGRCSGRIGSVIIIIWLIIGAIAAGQRHYYSSSDPNCARAGTIIVTVLAGPLNYTGVNPKITCKTPQPSK